MKVLMKRMASGTYVHSASEGQYEVTRKDRDHWLVRHYGEGGASTLAEVSTLAAARTKISEILEAAEAERVESAGWHRCPDCGWVGRKGQLHRNWDGYPRSELSLAEDSPRPSGECPKCVAFTYPL